MDNPAKEIFEQQVLPLFEANRAEWLAKARATAERLAAGGKTITIDMVRAECPPPADVDPKVMGAVFRPLGKWIKTGYVQSFRKASHGRAVAQFKLNPHFQEKE